MNEKKIDEERVQACERLTIYYSQISSFFLFCLIFKLEKLEFEQK